MRDLPEKIDSKFRFVLLAAQRAEQLMRGAQPKDVVLDTEKSTRTAMNELVAGDVEWDYGQAPQPVDELLAEGLADDVAADLPTEDA